MPILLPKKRFVVFLIYGLALGLLSSSIYTMATPLRVILVDHLSLSQVYDTSSGPLTPASLNGAVIALVSPGLPLKPSPNESLYATLTAGDVANVKNSHVGLLQRQLFVNGADQDITIEQFGDAESVSKMDALRREIARLRAKSSRDQRAPGILLVGVTPPYWHGHPDQWDSLTPIVWLSCGGQSSDSALQPTLTSDTTQTTGLIALRDIAPTLLETAGAPIPDSMGGHSAHIALFGAGKDRDTELRRMDALVRSNENLLIPFGWIYGIGSGAILFVTVWMILSAKRKYSSILRYLLRFVVAMPVALMIAGELYYGGNVRYAISIATIALLIAGIPNIGLILVLGASLIAFDGFSGSHMISRSLLSGYWLSGIRFYGIGNEYMGLLIGMALVGWFIRKDKDSSEFGWIASLGLGLWFCVILTALAYPQFGAKAGGAVTAMATFLPCWVAVVLRRRISLMLVAISVLFGFITIFGFTVLAHHLGGRETHIQAASSALFHGRFDYIAHIVLRKVKMAVRIALMPGTLVSIFGMIAIALIWRRSKIRLLIMEYLDGRERYKQSLVAGLWGIGASLLFNDSGIVAGFLIFGTLVLPLFHEMLCVSSPSMSVMSGSVLQSATSSS